MHEDRSHPRTIVELRGISRTVHEGRIERQVLRGIDLTLAGGEIGVVVGRSGSGKSTLLNIVGGIDSPTGGSVRVAGRELTGLGEEARTRFRRRHVGFVFQFFNLVPTLTVGENLLLPLELRSGRLQRRDRQRAHDLLDAVGLAERTASFPDVLSGGEQQRVAIARALAADPDLLLADEPTGNLDLDTGLEVLDLLDRLTRQAGKSLLMVTHSREVIGLADRLFVMESGRLRQAETAGATARSRRGGAAP